MALPILITRACKNGIRFYSGCIQVNDAYILSAARTPIGKFQGKLSSLTAVELATKALLGAIERSPVSAEDIQELILGCALATGMGQGVAHQVARYAGLKHTTITWFLNKLCASGMKAVTVGCQTLYSHAQEVVAAGGMEALTHVPFMMKRKSHRLGHFCLADLIFHDGFTDMIKQIDVTHYAEKTVQEFSLTREDQDKYTLDSYERAKQALANGVFKDEIVPVIVKNKDGVEEAICEDEQIGAFKEESLKTAKPDVGKEGTITSVNSSGLHDGASVIILASGNYVVKKDLQPIAKVVSFADACVPAEKFCIAPAIAIPKALVRANLSADDIAMWEINETFAMTVLANMTTLRLPPEKVNKNGGSISLGHPFGMTGNRLIVHMVHALNSGEYGCASVSHATGGASAIVIQKL